jgi:hypothetical protein
MDSGFTTSLQTLGDELPTSCAPEEHTSESGPAVRLGSTDTTGTAIDFKTVAPINHAVVGTLVEALRSCIQGLSIVLRSRDGSQ